MEGHSQNEDHSRTRKACHRDNWDKTETGFTDRHTISQLLLLKPPPPPRNRSSIIIMHSLIIIWSIPRERDYSEVLAIFPEVSEALNLSIFQKWKQSKTGCRASLGGGGER